MQNTARLQIMEGSRATGAMMITIMQLLVLSKVSKEVQEVDQPLLQPLR